MGLPLKSICLRAVLLFHLDLTQGEVRVGCDEGVKLLGALAIGGMAVNNQSEGIAAGHWAVLP